MVWEESVGRDVEGLQGGVCAVGISGLDSPRLAGDNSIVGKYTCTLGDVGMLLCNDDGVEVNLGLVWRFHTENVDEEISCREYLMQCTLCIVLLQNTPFVVCLNTPYAFAPLLLTSLLHTRSLIDPPFIHGCAISKPDGSASLILTIPPHVDRLRRLRTR